MSAIPSCIWDGVLQRFKVSLIDFGHASFKSESMTEDEWRRKEALMDEEGKIGRIMQSKLERKYGKVVFEYELSDWAAGLRTDYVIDDPVTPPSAVEVEEESKPQNVDEPSSPEVEGKVVRVDSPQADRSSSPEAEYKVGSIMSAILGPSSNPEEEDEEILILSPKSDKSTAHHSSSSEEDCGDETMMTSSSEEDCEDTDIMVRSLEEFGDEDMKTQDSGKKEASGGILLD